MEVYTCVSTYIYAYLYGSLYLCLYIYLCLVCTEIIFVWKFNPVSHTKTMGRLFGENVSACREINACVCTVINVSVSVGRLMYVIL